MSTHPIARRIFLDTLDQLRVPQVMHSRVYYDSGLFHVGATAYSLDLFRQIKIVSIGKAAVPMATTLLNIVKPHLEAHQTLDGIVVGTTIVEAIELRSYKGGHPVPDEQSLLAAEAVLQYLSDCDRDTLVFFLISGGASTMLEQPLDPSMTMDEIAAFHQALVHSGLPIQQMNALRKHFSAVKGGRLAVAAGKATHCTLLISDVPGTLTHIIGSGPTLPDPSTVAECRKILAGRQQALSLSDKMTRFFTVGTPETPKQGDSAFLRASSFMLLSSDDVCAEATRLATNEGFHVVVDNSCDEWPYDDAAEYLLRRFTKLQETYGRTCLLSTGEIAVKVQPGQGTGGRNQHFVLECARRMANNHQQAIVLSAGTDGIDGNSRAAGGLADETTIARAEKLGLSVVDALARFDSNALLTALDDTLVIGPTGNNVRDLRILLSAD